MTKALKIIQYLILIIILMYKYKYNIYYMSVSDLNYKNKYLKYKNKYLNLNITYIICQFLI